MQINKAQQKFEEELFFSEFWGVSKEKGQNLRVFNGHKISFFMINSLLSFK